MVRWNAAERRLGGWCSSWLKWPYRKRRQKEYWITSAGYFGHLAEGRGLHMATGSERLGELRVLRRLAGLSVSLNNDFA
jgi:hypothetical protein